MSIVKNGMRPVWLNLQLSYDLKIAEAELKDKIESEVEKMAA